MFAGVDYKSLDSPEFDGAIKEIGVIKINNIETNVTVISKLSIFAIIKLNIYIFFFQKKMAVISYIFL